MMATYYDAPFRHAEFISVSRTVISVPQCYASEYQRQILKQVQDDRMYQNRVSIQNNKRIC